MSLTPIHRTDEGGSARAARMALAFDPLLLLAALGLVAFSFITLRGAAPAYSHRQLIYAGFGFVAMVVIAAFDYSLLRRFRYLLYGLAIALNLVVLGMPARQGATRWIPLPFFPAAALRARQGAPDRRARRGRRRALAAAAEIRTTVRVLLLALLPALLVIAQPDLGTGLVYLVVAVAIL